MSNFSFKLVISVERENHMKNAFLSVLCLLIFGITCGQVDASSATFSGIPANTQPVMRGTSVGVMNINSMSPATYRYPANYAHHTYTMPNSNMFYGYPINDMNASNVNVFVGGYQPVYVMRSGMVKVNRNKNKRRSGRIKTTYEEEYYEN